MKKEILKKHGSWDFKILKLIIANFFIFALLLALLDISLGFFSNLRTKVPITSRFIQLREYPQLIDNDIVANINGLKFNTKIKTDINGFIAGPNDDLFYDRADIVFLGGSTTECYYLQPQNRFPYKLQHDFNQSSKKEIKVINAGVSGNSSINSNLILYSKVIELKPKIAFYMHNINDLVLLSKTKSYYKAPRGRAVILDSNDQGKMNFSFYYILRWIKNNFYPNLYMIFKNSLSIDDTYFIKKTGNKIDEFHEFRGNFYLTNKDDLNDIENKFVNSLNTFLNICKSNQIIPVLMTQPNRIDNNSRTFEEEFSENNLNESEIETFKSIYILFNEKIIETAKKNKIKYIDLNEMIPKSQEFIYDSVHLSDSGSVKVSNILLEFLKENLHLLN